jgi:hypothetical protein
MTQDVQVGTILALEWPSLFDLESAPYAGRWSMVQTSDGATVDRKVRALGWNLFFIASEVKVTFFGVPGAKKIENAMRRILGKVSQQHFNGLEVTGIAAKHFFGLPYAVVSAHSRHLQKTCYLDHLDVRRSQERDAAWARG